MTLDFKRIRINTIWTNIAPSNLRATRLDCNLQAAYVVLHKTAYGWEVFAQSESENEMFHLHELLMLATDAPKMTAFARLDVQSFPTWGALPSRYFPATSPQKTFFER